jgi:hypothetical protein
VRPPDGFAALVAQGLGSDHGDFDLADDALSRL